MSSNYCNRDWSFNGFKLLRNGHNTVIVPLDSHIIPCQIETIVDEHEEDCVDVHIGFLLEGYYITDYWFNIYDNGDLVAKTDRKKLTDFNYSGGIIHEEKFRSYRDEFLIIELRNKVIPQLLKNNMLIYNTCAHKLNSDISNLVLQFVSGRDQ